MGGMPSISPSFTGGMASGGTVGGGNRWDQTQGTWNVNLGGGGTAYQSATGGISPIVLIGAALIALYLLRK
jgi:hypothetical protein